MEKLTFGILAIILYFKVPQKHQWKVLLCINIIFYIYLGGYAAFFYFLFVALITFWIAIRIENVDKIGKDLTIATNEYVMKRTIRENISEIKKLLCMTGIILGMSLWSWAKYANFLIENINKLLNIVRIEHQINSLNIILSLGMSFYTFHAVGYLIDVYRGKYPAEKNFGKYFTFLSFFLHIVQGPFSRYDELSKSLLKKHSFSYMRLCAGCSRILWGITKKAVIADKIAPTITTVFSYYYEYSGIHIIFAMICYAIRLYADFSGYMDIVCGISFILDIELKENFRQPYFAKSIDEFWRRWHITLGAWFKDYLFYPISMGKIGRKMGKWVRNKWGRRLGTLLPGYLALVSVWTATGLWHGAQWGYLIWGYLNMVAILFTMQFSGYCTKIKQKMHLNTDCFLWKIFCMIRTFVLLCFFRLFTLTDNVHTAILMLDHSISNLGFDILKSPEKMFIEMRYTEIFVFLLGAAAILLIDVLNEIGKWEKVKSSCPMIVRNLVYTVLILSIILFAGESNDLIGGFMYANF